MGDVIIAFGKVLAVSAVIGSLFGIAAILREIRDLLKERLKGD